MALPGDPRAGIYSAANCRGLAAARRVGERPGFDFGLQVLDRLFSSHPIVRDGPAPPRSLQLNADHCGRSGFGSHSSHNFRAAAQSPLVAIF